MMLLSGAEKRCLGQWFLRESVLVLDCGVAMDGPYEFLSPVKANRVERMRRWQGLKVPENSRRKVVSA